MKFCMKHSILFLAICECQILQKTYATVDFGSSKGWVVRFHMDEMDFDRISSNKINFVFSESDIYMVQKSFYKSIVMELVVHGSNDVDYKYTSIRDLTNQTSEGRLDYETLNRLRSRVFRFTDDLCHVRRNVYNDISYYEDHLGAQGYEVTEYTPYMEYEINGEEVRCNLGNIRNRKRRSRSYSSRSCGPVHEYLVDPNSGLGPQLRLEQSGKAVPWRISIGTCIDPKANGGQATEHALLTAAIKSCNRIPSCRSNSVDGLLGVNCVRTRTAQQPDDYRLLRQVCVPTEFAPLEYTIVHNDHTFQYSVKEGTIYNCGCR